MDFKSVYLWDNVRRLMFILMLLLVAAGKTVSGAMIATLAVSLAAQVAKLVLIRREPQAAAGDGEKTPRGRTAEYVGIVLTGLLIGAVAVTLR